MLKCRKKCVKWKTLQKVTLFTYIDFSFFKDKQNLYRNKFSENKSLYKFFLILLTFHVSDFFHDFVQFLSPNGPKNKASVQSWKWVALSNALSDHQRALISTKRTTSSPAESHSGVAVIKTAKEGRWGTGVRHGRLCRRGRRVTCLSRRCPRGSRTALTEAVALSPKLASGPQAQRRHPVAAAGTAWREMSRPWRWEGYYWACAWSGGYKETAWNLGIRKEKQTIILISTNVAQTKPFNLTIKNQVADLWTTAGPPKPRWEPVYGNHPPNERRTQKRDALRQSMPGLGSETLISCC